MEIPTETIHPASALRCRLALAIPESSHVRSSVGHPPVLSLIPPDNRLQRDKTVQQAVFPSKGLEYSQRSNQDHFHSVSFSNKVSIHFFFKHLKVGTVEGVCSFSQVDVSKAGALIPEGHGRARRRLPRRSVCPTVVGSPAPLAP